jgi:hypothetical protein
MTVATDPKDVSFNDSDDEFDRHFEEFASGKKTDPDTEVKEEPGEPDGNGPDGEPPAPAEVKTEAATGTEHQPDDATSGDADPDGGSQPPEGEQAPDPWANVPAELKSQYEAVMRERDEARHKAQSDANRVAALSRKLSQLTTATPSSAPAPDDQPSEAQKALDNKIEQLRKDYGDIADPLIELIENQRKELSTVRTVLTGLSEERQAQVIATETQALEARHPDWRTIANSPDFGSWLEVQPPNIQSLATSWDARETSVVLTLFKAEKAETTGPKVETPAQEPTPKADAATGARRSQQLDGGRDVRSKPAPAASDAPEDFDAAFEFFAQKRNLKEAQNRRR